MNNDPKVSVIIPVYNGGQYIRGAVESVLNQTFKDLEIIVIDDGSTDRTKDVLSPWINEGKIVYFFQQNKGLAGARNTGIKLSKGKFLKFLDRDDLLYPQILEKQVDHLANKPETLISTTDYELEFPSKNKKAVTIWIGKENRQLARFIEGNPCPVHTILIRSDVVRRANGFDEDLRCHEDTFLWQRLLIQNCSFEKIDFTGCLYRILDGALSDNRDKMFHQHCRFSERMNQLLLPQLQGLGLSVIDQLLITNTRLVHACFLRKMRPNSVLPKTIQALEAVYMMKTNKIKGSISKIMGIQAISYFQYLKRTSMDKSYCIQIRDMDVFWRDESHYA